MAAPAVVEAFNSDARHAKRSQFTFRLLATATGTGWCYHKCHFGWRGYCGVSRCLIAPEAIAEVWCPGSVRSPPGPLSLRLRLPFRCHLIFFIFTSLIFTAAQKSERTKKAQEDEDWRDPKSFSGICRTGRYYCCFFHYHKQKQSAARNKQRPGSRQEGKNEVHSAIIAACQRQKCRLYRWKYRRIRTKIKQQERSWESQLKSRGKPKRARKNERIPSTSNMAAWNAGCCHSNSGTRTTSQASSDLEKTISVVAGLLERVIRKLHKKEEISSYRAQITKPSRRN